MPQLVRTLVKAVAFVALAITLILGATALWVNRLAARGAAAYPPAGRFLMVDGTRLHYVDAGSARSGESPIVLIHGNPGGIQDFERLAPLLATSHRVIAVDRPGHGYSRRPDMRAATPLAQARQLHAALDQLGVRRPILVGHSWGGALALGYATEFPDDVAGLVLLGTRAYPVEGPPDPLYALLRRPVIGPVLRHTLVPVLGRGTLDARMSDAYLPDSVQAGHLAFAQALWMRPGELGATVWDTFLLQGEAGEMARKYSTVGVPVMLLVGDQDALLPESQQLANQLPNAWIEVLSNTGHYLPRTRVAEIQRSVEVLEARLRAGTSSVAGSRSTAR